MPQSLTTARRVWGRNLAIVAGFVLMLWGVGYGIYAIYPSSPTIHFQDVQEFLRVLDDLLEQDDFDTAADYVIGCDPEKLAAMPMSPKGRFLASLQDEIIIPGVDNKTAERCREDGSFLYVRGDSDMIRSDSPEGVRRWMQHFPLFAEAYNRALLKRGL